MNKLFLLIKWEFLIQNRINNLTKYLIIFFLFCTCSIVLINNHSEIEKFGIIFSSICLPLALMSFSGFIIKPDLNDGSLELLLSSFHIHEIIFAKFCAIYSSAILSAICIIPVIYIFFGPEVHKITYLFLSLCLLLALCSALLVLSGTIQSYFRSNTNLSMTLIMPLLIPSIVMNGLILQDAENIKFIFIMLAIDLIVLPVLFFFSSYLLKNIYSI